ncbi:MAG: LPP20 family lipoprotein [Deltaproteobacteria bacterium]|nr:LPP20 family lipoprotein [Deltaproteobacteria bacterium]MBW2218487.1 LPP20 family lipoprotein [Deltaproteobacteria bacterium]
MVERCLLFIMVFFVSLFCTIGCATSDSDVAEPKKTIDFSSERYLTATGIGQTDAEARRMAKAEMSAIFESKIESQIDSSVKLITDLEENEDVKKKTEANIKIKSSVQLQGVEIKQNWYDEKSRLYYAKAVLDKYMAREQWSDRLTNLESDVDAKFERLAKTKSLLLRLESLKRLYNLMIEKETIINRLRVIGFPAISLPEYNAGSTMEMVMDIKTKMLIHIDVNGHQAKEVVGKISESLTEKGYKLTPSKQNADVLITGTVKTEPVILDNAEWEFSRATVSITVSDQPSNSEVIKINKNVRKGHINYSEASRKAAISAAQKVSEEIVEYFGI